MSEKIKKDFILSLSKEAQELLAQNDIIFDSQLLTLAPNQINLPKKDKEKIMRYITSFSKAPLPPDLTKWLGIPLDNNNKDEDEGNKNEG